MAPKKRGVKRIKRKASAKKAGRRRAKTGPGRGAANPKAVRTMGRLERAIADPCNAPLDGLPGGCGDTLIKRVRNTITVHPTAANNCGYIVWFPGFHNQGGSTVAYGMSALRYEPAATATGITNSSVNPMGTALTSSGVPVADPAYGVVTNGAGVFRTATSLAACMSIRYIGALSACAGEFCLVTNFQPSSAYNSATNTGPSVDNLFAAATHRGRIPLKGGEVKWVPTADPKPRGVGSDNAASAGLGADNCFVIGSAGAYASTIIDPAGSEGGIAIAWRGLNTTTTSDIVVDLTKIVELDINPSGGGAALIESKPYTPPAAATYSIAVNHLDAGFPDWRTTAGSVVTEMLWGLGRKAFETLSRAIRVEGAAGAALAGAI